MARGDNLKAMAPHGRPKGSKNKFTIGAKEAFQRAFDGMGGAHRLQVWAHENATDFYKLYARLIPAEVSSSPDAPLKIIIERK